MLRVLQKPLSPVTPFFSTLTPVQSHRNHSSESVGNERFEDSEGLHYQRRQVSEVLLAISTVSHGRFRTSTSSSSSSSSTSSATSSSSTSSSLSLSPVPRSKSSFCGVLTSPKNSNGPEDIKSKSGAGMGATGVSEGGSAPRVSSESSGASGATPEDIEFRHGSELKKILTSSRRNTFTRSLIDFDCFERFAVDAEN
ncbi:hypothetical protein GCK72_003471 [Caenorhabditis remanei]|uniref:Uncharacterized protein n=1 Tax=Caenorhabditis remanei TaxID=31234 RepID=A0A6A5HXE7_CAERE|nr:hypothetical protein GCK72_003471 [Caenorhabditis remanei]KAF1771644.1 hypothetical protein GCK72_003471 [Caenorhabditis remanei]